MNTAQLQVQSQLNLPESKLTVAPINATEVIDGVADKVSDLLSWEDRLKALEEQVAKNSVGIMPDYNSKVSSDGVLDYPTWLFIHTNGNGTYCKVIINGINFGNMGINASYYYQENISTFLIPAGVSYSIEGNGCTVTRYKCL